MQKDLGNTDFKGRVCLSAPSLDVNRTLISMLIAEHGMRPAEIIVRGWIANLALPAFESEADLLDAIASGTCALGIASSGATLVAATGSVSVLTPQPTYAVAEAAGVARHARSPDAARRLIEWFVSREAQALHTQRPGYYPSNGEGQIGSMLPGELATERNVGIAGAYAADADKLAERASWH
jgi:iron(III) transport system substrate-binding protein